MFIRAEQRLRAGCALVARKPTAAVAPHVTCHMRGDHTRSLPHLPSSCHCTVPLTLVDTGCARNGQIGSIAVVLQVEYKLTLKAIIRFPVKYAVLTAAGPFVPYY